MKKELLRALIASDQLISQKIWHYQTRIDENYKLLEGLDDDNKEIKEGVDNRIEFYSDLINEYQEHLKAIRDLMDENVRNLTK